MITALRGYAVKFNTECVQPTVEWSNKHKILVSIIGASILFGGVCYKSSTALDFTKKNVKFLTVVFPVAYTLPAPLIFLATSLQPGGISYDSGKARDGYYESIGQVWQAWFKYVGISA